jgi:hypothetical protein
MVKNVNVTEEMRKYNFTHGQDEVNLFMKIDNQNTEIHDRIKTKYFMRINNFSCIIVINCLTIGS